MRISVIASLIVAVHLGVVVMVMAPGCTTVKRNPPAGPAQAPVQQPADYVEPPEIPVMPPTIDATVPPAAVLPPVVGEVDVPEKPASENVYVVRNGDSLSKIAARHGVKTADIASLNGIADANKIQVGQKLLLPAYATESQSKPAAAAPAAAAPETTKIAAGQTVYEVKNGDALSKIAKRFGVKQSAIMEANGIKDANKIRIGQKLTIPGAGEAAPAAPAKAADVPAEPAPAAPAEAAPAAEPETSAPAAPAVPAAAAPAVPEGSIPFVVSEGDTVDSIAAVFTIDKASLLRANNLQPGAVLTPGQTVLIPPSP